MPQEEVKQYSAKLQYYDAGFIAEEGNVIYHNLINCVPIKPPYFNSSIRTIFTQSPSERGDKNRFFVTKRKGFKKVPIYKRNSSETSLVKETDEEWINGHVTDMAILDGYRYFFYLNSNKTKMRVYKQINLNDKSLCSNACYNDITEGHIVNVTRYTYIGQNGPTTIDYFPFTPCTYDKFVLTTHVKGQPKFDGKCTLISVRDYDVINSYFYSEDLSVKINTTGGDYVFTYGDIAPGFVVQVGLTNQVVNGINDAVAITGTWSPAIEMQGDIGVIKGVSLKIFPEYGLTLHFATADGLVHLHDVKDRPSTFAITMNGDLSFCTMNNANEPRIHISSIAKLDQSILVLDQKTGRLFVGGQGYMKFYFSPLRIVLTDGLYNRMVQYMGLCLLLGPHNIGYFTFDWQTNVGVLQEITDSNGYFSENSFVNVDEKFYIIRNSKDFYFLELQFGYKQQKPMIIFTPMMQFIHTDLDLLHHGVDEISLVVDDNDIKIFINNGTGNGKVLIYDRYYKLRYKWYITGCEITSVKDGIYMGRGIFSYEGETDDGNDITQIITMMYGDNSHTSNKYIISVKLPIGYNSYIEKGKSFFVCSSDSGGWFYESLYDDLTRAEYIENNMRLKINSVRDNETLQVVRSYPLGILIKGGKGKNTGKSIANSYTEFEEYKNYSAPLTGYGDSTETFGVSKFGIVNIPLGMRGEMHTFELVATGNNRIEFGGFFIVYVYKDIDKTRLENNLTKYDLTIDSGQTRVPHKSSDEILGINT